MPLNLPMNIVIFGATGRTGALLVEQAIEAGHFVTAAARRPEGIVGKGPNLRKVNGDLFNAKAVADAVAGQDCVFVAVAPPKPLGPTTIFSTGITHILAGMKAAQVRRIVVLGSCGVDGETNTRWHTRLLAGLIVQPLLFNLYVDTGRMEGILTATDCDWTVVRPPRLTNGKATAAYRVGVGTHLPHVASISRADVADAMLALISDTSTYRRWVEVASHAWI
jgi:putative NADH-flavin reductase